MTKIASLLTLLVTVLVGLLPAVPAQAQNTRSFVSGLGNDLNNCSLAAPCRTFQHAHDQTTAGGEIAVLDTAGYGAVTINRSISIVNPGGVEAGISVPSGGTAITINAGSSDAVSLRGLTIEGAGTGATGVKFNSGQSLTVENCVIRHFTTGGILFDPTGSSNLLVSNTLVADNNGGDGIYVEPSSISTIAVTVVLNHVELSNNSGNGIVLNGTTSIGTINATVAESVAARNGNTGFNVQSQTGQAATTLMLLHSVAANNGTGLLVQGATIRIAQSTVTGNSVDGYSIGLGGVLDSYTDNYIDGNVGTQSAPANTLPKK